MTSAKRTLTIVLALMAGILICHGQVRHFDFVNLDDGVYVYENPMVLAGINGDGVRWAFTTTEGANWHPLTWLSLMLDTEIYGTHPGGYHTTNLLFHIANVLLLFFILFRMTGAMWPSAFAAGLFALHPLHVESVAWISERKDVLSAFWGLLAIGCYGIYAAHRSRAAYWAAFGCLLLGLMAKPMLVTWPFLFLLLDYWPLGRWTPPDSSAGVPRHRFRTLLFEKIPFILPVGVVSWTTLMAQSERGAVVAVNALPLLDRVANAALSYIWYVWKVLWPAGLNVYYTHPGIRVSIMAAAGAALLLTGISFAAVRAADRFPFVPVGWFWYLGTLVPVIGLVQVGLQAQADRYAYIPMIGLYIIVSWLTEDVARQRKWNRLMLLAAALAVLMALGLRTHVQVAFWRNSETLYRRALQVDPENDLAHNNLGNALGAKGNTREAEEHYLRAVQINPLNHQAWNNYGNRLFAEGEAEAAKHAYKKAISVNPDFPTYYYNLGIVLLNQGNIEHAIEQFSKTLEIDPGFVRAYNVIGMLFVKQGKLESARKFFTMAIEVDPDFTSARDNLMQLGTSTVPLDIEPEPEPLKE